MIDGGSVFASDARPVELPAEQLAPMATPMEELLHLVAVDAQPGDHRIPPAPHLELAARPSVTKPSSAPSGTATSRATMSVRAVGGRD